MRRRDFLATAGASAAALSLLPRNAYAGWGDAPSTASSLLLGPGERAERCLEIYLYGGVPSWHSFYAVPEYGSPSDPTPALQNTMYYLFGEDKRTVWGQDCGSNDPTAWLTPFGTDTQGAAVHFTPMIAPLLERPDILARTRVIVTRHDFLPHEVAVPYMLTGSRFGNPRMAGLGSHVQRYWNDHGDVGRVVPYSYIFSPQGALTSFNLASASAVGQHPGSAKPLHVLTSTNTDIATLVGRTYLSADDRSRVDALANYYSQRASGQYSNRAGEALRSRGVSDHQFAMSSLINAPNLQDVLTPQMFTPPYTMECGFPNVQDVSAMTIDAAVSLLTHPTTPAKYVNVVDGGNVFYGDLPYDVHSGLVDTGTKNLRHTLQRLVDSINLPGEGDPSKLDIDDTLVFMTGDFGRSPLAQNGDGPFGGSDHWPWGFVTIMIGGPVQPGVVGAIGPDGYAIDYLQGSEIRAAALAALGMYPFSPESFAVGDIGGASSEADGLAWLNEYVLGRAS